MSEHAMKGSTTPADSTEMRQGKETPNPDFSKCIADCWGKPVGATVQGPDGTGLGTPAGSTGTGSHGDASVVAKPGAALRSGGTELLNPGSKHPSQIVFPPIRDHNK